MQEQIHQQIFSFSHRFLIGRILHEIILLKKDGTNEPNKNVIKRFFHNKMITQAVLRTTRKNKKHIPISFVSVVFVGTA